MKANGILVITSECSHCHGRGLIRSASPQSLRKARLDAEIGLCELARRLKLSAAYLSDVERGNRRVTERLLAAYEQIALEAK